MKLSVELGKHLHEIMDWSGPLTHRQYLAWQGWLIEQQGQPSRSDYYQMQTSLEVCRANAKEPGKLKLDNFRLRFSTKQDSKDGSTERGLTKQDILQFHKNRWVGVVTQNGKVELEHRTVDPPGAS